MKHTLEQVVSCSVISQNNKIRQPGQPLARLTKRKNGLRGGLMKLAAQCDRLIQSQQRNIGRLVVCSILAGGFAQPSRVCGDIQHIVHHLKGQSYGARVMIQCLSLLRARTRNDTTQSYTAH